jgi:hypothetical protein
MPSCREIRTLPFDLFGATTRVPFGPRERRFFVIGRKGNSEAQTAWRNVEEPTACFPLQPFGPSTRQTGFEIVEPGNLATGIPLGRVRATGRNAKREGADSPLSLIRCCRLPFDPTSREQGFLVIGQQGNREAARQAPPEPCTSAKRHRFPIMQHYVGAKQKPPQG